MKNELLTLVRELEIVRDENIALRARVMKQNEHYQNSKKFGALMFRMVGQLKFMSNSNSERIAANCRQLVDDYHELLQEIKNKSDRSES